MRRRGHGLEMTTRTVLWGAVLAAVCAAPVVARADVASDQAAAILVFPKLVVDTADPARTTRGRIDTLIRISNTSSQPVTVRCFYVNANSHCLNAPSTICNADLVGGNPCGATALCVQGWQESDFTVNITARQPVAWLASQGAAPCSTTADPNRPCFPIDGNGTNDNGGSLVQPVGEDPFVGELKCVAVDRNDAPVERNVLKGEAEIIRSNPGFVDVEGYNAIGIPAVSGRNDHNSTLVISSDVCLGGANAQQPCVNDAGCPGSRCLLGEYNACPSILILDHFLDGAKDPVSGDTITTDLTLVPCSEDFLNQAPVKTTVQFLVFNEFEQRFSTSRPLTCFQEFKLSDIDRAGPNRSIFSAAVGGTLTGQTRIRGVADQDQTHGHTLLGVAEEFRNTGGTAAFNLHFSGTRGQADFLYLPPPQ
jgi:hypothetical protein